MIRYAIESDFDTIYQLGNQMTPTFSKTNNLEEISKDKYTKILVYEQEQEVIAFLMYVVLTETVDILDIFVREDKRGEKIASCLMDYMISGLPDTVQMITLEVRESNESAIHLYENFGFEIVSVRKNYYADGENGFLMGRVMKK